MNILRILRIEKERHSLTDAALDAGWTRTLARLGLTRQEWKQLFTAS
jgi:hypothetical protein